MFKIGQREFFIYFVLAICIFGIAGCKRNKCPAVPPAPTGLADNKGWTDSTYYFYTSALDPEGDDIAYQVKWGDGVTSEWTDYVASGVVVTMGHKYTTSGNFNLQAKAKDIHNNETEWSEASVLKILSKSRPPDSMTISLLTDTSIISTTVQFSVRAVDPDTDSVKFFVKWGPTDSGWVDRGKYHLPSGGTGTIEHTYQDTGIFEVKMKASDLDGSMSLNWSASCTVKVTPPNKPHTPPTPATSAIATRFTRTPYLFSTSLAGANYFVGNNGDLLVQFNWGDDSSLSMMGEKTVDQFSGDVTLVEGALYHAYQEEGVFSVTAQFRDKWMQYSDSSGSNTITVTDNYLNKWSVDTSCGITIFGDTIFIVDWANHDIKMYEVLDPNVLVGTIGTSILKAPKYIAVDSECIYVTDAFSDWEEIHKVYVFNKDGSLKTSWGGKSIEGSDGKFYCPTGIAVDSEYVYVVDSFNKRIQKFTKDGTYITKWQIPGEALGMKLDGDRLYIASNRMDIVYVYSTSGTFIKSIGASLGGDKDGYLSVPCDVAIFGSYLYVVESGVLANNHRVQKFSKTGSGESAFLTRWGEQGSEDRQFKSPQGIATDNSGNIYVVDTGNCRVQIFKP